MSNKADDDPTIPPEWVRVFELPGWVRRICRTDDKVIVRRELILAVRHRELPHRVQYKSRPVSLSSPRHPSLPPGLVEQAHGFQDKRVVVASWELAEADWKDCTVGGWNQGDGTRQRLPIEVPWKNVADLV